LVIKKGRLRWFGEVECKVDAEWIKRFTTMEFNGTRQRGDPSKTWWEEFEQV